MKVESLNSKEQKGEIEGFAHYLNLAYSMNLLLT